MARSTNPRVDEYIDAAPEWQQEVFRAVRELLHGADPDVEETIKRSVQPYFVLEGNIAAFQSCKNHVNVFLYDPLVTDPEGVITHGHEGKTGRQISIYEGDDINAPALQAIFEEIIAHNRAGGWRKLQKEGA